MYLPLATMITLLLWDAPLASALAGQPAAARPPAGASVYKCAGASGSVVYQDSPCAPGTELRNFAIDPPTLSVVPGAAPAPPPPSAATARGDRSAVPARTRESRGDASERRYIRVGMSQAEVLQRLGRPDVDARNQRGKGQRWSYLPRSGDSNTITTVTLVDGKVADVERKIVR
jgi:uncharacterized protein DUF4124